MVKLLGLCRRFALEYLGWKGECVDQEKFGEFFELFNFSCTELFVVVGTLISVKADEMRPLLQIRGELSGLCKQVNTLCQHLAGKRWIKIASGRVNGLAEHGSRSVGISAASIIEALQEGSPNRLGDTLRRQKTVRLGILSNNSGSRLLYPTIEIPGESIQPLCVIGAVQKADAKNFAASITGERHGTFCVSYVSSCHGLHGNVGSAAVRAISNKGYGHIHSIGAQSWASWRQA